MLKMIVAAHRIGRTGDQKTLEVERRQRTLEKDLEKEKTDLLRATTATHRRQEEVTRRAQEKEVTRRAQEKEVVADSGAE